jgi:hypothetical protein
MWIMYTFFKGDFYIWLLIAYSSSLISAKAFWMCALLKVLDAYFYLVAFLLSREDTTGIFCKRVLISILSSHLFFCYVIAIFFLLDV